MIPKGMKEARRAFSFYLGALRAFLWTYAIGLYNASGGSPDGFRTASGRRSDNDFAIWFFIATFAPVRDRCRSPCVGA